MAEANIIKNPLTIIAAFAALAEVSGTAVLPLIAETNQFYYICFLIIFPILLVILFFLTLNFNHHVLYAPSDFRDEANYFKRLTKSTSGERLAKIQEEVEEIEAQKDEMPAVVAEVAPADVRPIPPPVSDVGSSQGDIRESYERVERLALRKLAFEWPQPIIPQMTLELSDGRKILTDAVALDGKDATVFEIKYFSGRPLSPGRVRSSIRNLIRTYKDLPEEIASHIGVVLVIVNDGPVSKLDQERIVFDLKADDGKFDYLRRVIFYDRRELEAKFGSN